jgi:PKHD-type hydroxylase
MLLHLKNLLGPTQLGTARALLGEAAPWTDGRSSAGTQAVQAKHNQQLAQDSETSRQLQALILQALQSDPMFFSAALPRKIFHPLFNRYRAPGEHYGNHVDGAVLYSQASREWVRSDLSCTVFLSEPSEYDGGELQVQDTLGSRSVKLAAGDAILYPGSSVHAVTPVTRGVRLASFLWIESMVRSEEHRRLLFDLDMTLLDLRQRHGETPEAISLTGTYHNLLRMWANT